MQYLLEKIKGNLSENLILITVSNPRKAQDIKKYTVRPLMMKDSLIYQMTGHTQTQVYHENLSAEAVLNKLEEILPLYKQVLIKTVEAEITALLNKQGKAAVKIRKGTAVPAVNVENRLSHNRKKKYILTEGMKVPFLIDLGVMTQEGKIVNKKYDKFRQINRFLEFIRDIAPHLPQDREITILDFGCGKSYLTFAMYYYLHELEGLDVRIIGLDLKSDVIDKCNKLAKKYRYNSLTFLKGAIEDYEGVSQIDMVVTLHACDTATDYALYKAVKWGAKVILSVPCCQHELNGQMQAEGEQMTISPVADYGILKERFAAMATDGIRAKLLEAMGYETQILEFIDMEHTPKNLLIRAVRNRAPKPDREEEVRAFCRQFGFHPTLMTLLQEEELCQK